MRKHRGKTIVANTGASGRHDASEREYSDRHLIDRSMFKHTKTEESEEPPQMRMARKVLSSIQPVYPFDLKAVQVEQRLQSEYSNIINYAKEKLNLASLKLTTNTGAFKRLASKDGRAKPLGKDKLNTHREGLIADKAQLTKAKDIMLKYIKYFHLKKRKEHLRIGHSEPRRKVHDSRSLEKAIARESDEHRICDIWSMNFFEQHESQKDENKVTKKQQLQLIKESINKEKQRRLVIQNNGSQVLERSNNQVERSCKNDAQINEGSMQMSFVTQPVSNSVQITKTVGGRQGRLDPLCIDQYSERPTSAERKPILQNRGTVETIYSRQHRKSTILYKAPSPVQKDNPKVGIRNFRLSMIETEQKAVAAVRALMTKVDYATKTMNLPKKDLGGEVSSPVQIAQDTPEKSSLTQYRKTNNWQSLNTIPVGALQLPKDRRVKKTATYQISSSAQLSPEDAKKSLLVETVKTSVLKQIDCLAKTNSPSKTKNTVDAWIMQNLFNGLVVVSTPAKSEVPSFVVGEGNNQSLMQKILGQFRPWQHSGFYNRANFVWTQLVHKKVTSTVDAPRLSVELLAGVKHYQATQSLAVSILTDQLLRMKLFKVNNRRLIEEVFDNLVNILGEVSMLTRETLNIANHVKDLKSISRKNLLYLTLKEHLETNPETDGAVYSLKYEKGKQPLIPRTYLLWGNTFDEDLEALMTSKYESDMAFENPLIIKPGQFSNRGVGISMAFTMSEAITLCKQTIEKRKSSCSVIVQEYLSKPLLFKDRKFDVRCYALVVRFFDRISYYWYSQGYARTSSFVYDHTARDNLMVHLTNEAVQVKGKQSLR